MCMLYEIVGRIGYKSCTSSVENAGDGLLYVFSVLACLTYVSIANKRILQ